MNDQNYASMYDMPAQTVPDVQAPPQPKITYSRTEHITALLAFPAAFLAVRLFLYHTTGLFTTLFGWVLVTLALVFLRKTGRTLRPGDKVFAAVLYLFPLVYTLSANPLMRALTTVFLLVAGSLFLYRTANPEASVLRFLPVSLTASTLAAPLIHFPKGFQAAAQGTVSKNTLKHVGYVFAGLALAVPVTCVAASLLVNADENMATLLGNLIYIPTSEVVGVIACLIAAIPASAFLFSQLYTAAHSSLTLSDEKCEEGLAFWRFVPNTIVYAAATPLCILYVLFFISQLRYLTGGFLGQTVGFTYAEYARRGFFELCAVCCINLAMLAGMAYLSRVSGAVKPLLLRIYSGFLCVSSLVLAGTALAKMGMYIRIYGMSRLRVYTTWFMVLLVLVFGAILVRQFLPRLNLGRFLAITFTVMFALLCFSRPDAWITRYNAEMYLAGALEEFDSSMVQDMSDDAWAVLATYDDATLERLSNGEAFSSPITSEMLENRTESQDFWERLNLSAVLMRTHK